MTGAQRRGLPFRTPRRRRITSTSGPRVAVRPFGSQPDIERGTRVSALTQKLRQLRHVGRDPPRLNCPRKLGWDPILGDCSKIVFENRERSFEYPEHVFHLPAVATARSYFSNQLALFCD